MWTSTLYLEPRRIFLSKFLGFFYPDVYYTSLAPLQVENLPRQQLQAPGWVRIRNHLAGICGSDLHLVKVDGDLRVAPAALPGNRRIHPGHEVVGEVIEVGEDTQHLQIGDRVVLQHGPNCHSTGAQPPCRSCEAGQYNLCEYGELPGPEPIGGGWSEEMLLHEQQLFLLPDTLSDEQGMLLEPSSVAVHAVLRRLPARGERVLIIGAGTIGLLTLQVVRALAPEAEISMLIRHSFQVEHAKNMGAHHIIYPQDSYSDVAHITEARSFRGLFGNRMLLGGFDVIYDTVGRPATVHNALRWTRAGGTVVLVGVDLHQMSLDLTPVWYREINLIGSTSHGLENWPVGSQQQRETFSIAAELIQQELIHPEQIITHRFALSNYQDALRTASGKSRSRAVKVAFDYSLQPATAVPNLRASGRQRYAPFPTPAVPLTPVTTPSTPVPTGQATWQHFNRDTNETDQQTETVLRTVKPEQSIQETPLPASIDFDEEDEGFQPTLKFPRAVVPKTVDTKNDTSPASPPKTSERTQTREPEPIILTSSREDEASAYSSASQYQTSEEAIVPTQRINPIPQIEEYAISPMDTPLPVSPEVLPEQEEPASASLITEEQLSAPTPEQEPAMLTSETETTSEPEQSLPPVEEETDDPSKSSYQSTDTQSTELASVLETEITVPETEIEESTDHEQGDATETEEIPQDTPATSESADSLLADQLPAPEELPDAQTRTQPDDAAPPTEDAPAAFVFELPQPQAEAEPSVAETEITTPVEGTATLDESTAGSAEEPVSAPPAAPVDETPTVSIRPKTRNRRSGKSSK